MKWQYDEANARWRWLNLLLHPVCLLVAVVKWLDQKLLAQCYEFVARPSLFCLLKQEKEVWFHRDAAMAASLNIRDSVSSVAIIHQGLQCLAPCYLCRRL